MTLIRLKVAEKLAKIARKPDHSPRTMLILTQRMVRISLARLAEIRAERRVFRREAAKLQGYPFTRQQMDRLLEKSRTHRDDDVRDIKRGLIGMGYHLIKDTDNSYDAIGFDCLCDLLSINPVHRPAIQNDERGLAGLIYVARLENSASPQSEGWGEGGPLFEACFMAMVDWIKTAPEGDLPDLFGPGSPFAGVEVVQVNPWTDSTGPSSETLQ
ncbi:hypothetical protein [Pseudomonas putida]|uniref:hypothetical protein n=1 Tax=Pseudomonas TaxID=286 RepID=UPI0018D6A238|nr:hypothetical protein [Pseudomonas putida]MBH3412741.1 hypothetical protein [Pseudomonas putida]MBS5845980.1 hypothetical protein [Pseudomonas putida]MCZ9638537.1 hypothetical protein [Pseudomonas putida]